MIANIVANLFGADCNWPLGAAVAMLILAMVLVIVTIAQQLTDIHFPAKPHSNAWFCCR
jgi:ABC-type spermidine/putrescine transport system permease subunit I